MRIFQVFPSALRKSIDILHRAPRVSDSEHLTPILWYSARFQEDGYGRI